MLTKHLVLIGLASLPLVCCEEAGSGPAGDGNCRSDICGDSGTDCCAPEEWGDEPSCLEDGYTPYPGGTSSFELCAEWFSERAVYQCCRQPPAEGVCSMEWCASPGLDGTKDCWAGTGTEPCSCTRGQARETGNTIEYDGDKYWEYTCCEGGQNVGEACGEYMKWVGPLIGVLVVLCCCGGGCTMFWCYTCKKQQRQRAARAAAAPPSTQMGGMATTATPTVSSAAAQPMPTAVATPMGGMPMAYAQPMQGQPVAYAQPMQGQPMAMAQPMPVQGGQPPMAVAYAQPMTKT